MSAENSLLLIFTRNIVRGKCKTRLAKTIGDHRALEVYRFLVAHTAAISAEVQAKKEVYYSESISNGDRFDDGIFSKKVQQGDDLGERMSAAFAAGFEAGYTKMVIVGSDMYDLNTADINSAFSHLDEYDFVIGPAEDGGYYLLGMRVFYPQVFATKSWGSDSVLSDTLKDLENFKVKLLDLRNDVDIYDDIKDIGAFAPFLKDLKI